MYIDSAYSSLWDGLHSTVQLLIHSYFQSKCIYFPALCQYSQTTGSQALRKNYGICSIGMLVTSPKWAIDKIWKWVPALLDKALFKLFN